MLHIHYSKDGKCIPDFISSMQEEIEDKLQNQQRKRQKIELFKNSLLLKLSLYSW